MGGVISIRITSADCMAVLEKMRQMGIVANRIHFVDEFTMEFQIQGKYLKIVTAIIKKRNEKMEILERRGAIWTLFAYMKRPVLLSGILILLCLTLYLPTRVFFFRVEGNHAVPTRQIIESVTQCGVGFGTSRQEIRSEKIKNALLQSMPQLEWVGINTQGCVVIISLRERQQTDATNENTGVSSIVATRDGVIQHMEVTGGNPICKVGQAVKAGQILISGYTDCGLTIRAERAKGEVYATTNRHLIVTSPSNWRHRGQKTNSTRKFYIKFGKNQINFYQDSGISDSRCVKMYEENYLTLPGGFILPVAIVTEIWTYYEEYALTSSLQQAQTSLSALANSYLQSQTVAGKILSKQEFCDEQEGIHLLEGEYYCLEMIGREQSEEIIAP